MAFTNSIISLLGAVASIVTTGQKRPGPTQQNNTKPSKKPRQIKKEVIKQEIPRVQLPVTKIDTGDIIAVLALNYILRLRVSIDFRFK